MKKKAALLTFVGLVAVFALAVDQVEARNREARPGQTYRTPAPSKVGGPDCANATNVTDDGSNYTFGDSDNSCGATDKVSDYNNFGTGGPCNTVPYPGPDLIYTFRTTGPMNSVTADLDPATADMGVFILSDCPNGLSCLGFEDQIGQGAQSTITLTDLAVGQYYIYVDSYYPTGPESCSDYTLTVTGVVPVELMEFEVE